MEDKKSYVKMIELILKADDRSDIAKCTYIKSETLEEVRLLYNCGYKVRINVTANSLGAILKEVAREVYGSGAVGTFYRGSISEKAMND